MGLCCARPCFTESRSNVEIIQKMTEGNTLIRTYHTPVGSVTEKLRIGIGYGQARYGRDWKGITPKRVEYPIRTAEDYDTVKFIVEDTRCTPYYEAIEDAQHHLGEDGIVIAQIGYSPFQSMLIEWAGATRLYIDLFRNRDKIEELYSAMAEKQHEMFHIAAHSPSEYVGYGDNIDGVMINPQLFEQYHIPMHNKCADIVHEEDKILGVHMDGRLRNLSKLIAKSRVDVVEAFTPPPLGDLPLNEAKLLWEDKAIWLNFPSSIYILGPDATKRHLQELLKEAIPGNQLILAASTENMVNPECLKAITEVMEETTLPLV